MISTLGLPTELTEETIGYVVEKLYKPRSGSIAKVYIPKIMQNIEQGKPKIKTCSVQYHGGIINDTSCKPVIAKIFKEQNYLTGILEGNSNIESIASKSKKVPYATLNLKEKYVDKLFRSEVITADAVALALKKSIDNGETETKIVNQEVSSGQKVRVIFYNGKLTQIRLNTDDTKKDPNKDERWDKNYSGKKGVYAS